MQPSPRPPPLDDVPSSPSSEWSCAHSQSPSPATQDHHSPLTPESYFPPLPATITPDDFALRLDAQFDNIVDGPPRKSSLIHLLSQPSVPSLTAGPLFLPDDDMTQVFTMNRGRWEGMYDRFEGSLPLRPHNAPRDVDASRDTVNDALPSGAIHSALVGSNEPPDLLRYSLLIHEVSLLVGLATDDDHLASADHCPLVSDGPKPVPNILPLSLTPTKSLASRKHRNTSMPDPTDTNVRVYPSTIPFPPSVYPRADHASAGLRDEKPSTPGSGNLVTPVTCRKGPNAVRPSLSPRRRHGQIFLLETPPGNACQRSAVDLDEAFSHPRQPPPKPTPIPPANRCSSLDRLECSLRKLETHAPGSHRKSQSEGRSSEHVPQRKDKRPSLPPLPHLNKQRSMHEVARPNPSRPAAGCHVSILPPVPRSMPPHQHVVPRISPTFPLDDERREDRTPGSFMDMDIPPAEEASKTRRASFLVTNKAKIKGLARVARRISREVIAWGKNLTRPTKPSAAGQQMAIVRSAPV